MLGETAIPAADGTRVARGLERVPSFSGVVLVGLGCLVLLGWLLGLPFITNLHPSFAPMKPNTALGFIALGVALSQAPRPSSRAGRVRKLCASFAAVLGCATLIEYALDVDLAIDQLVLRDTWSTVNPGRMSITAASEFTCLGLALLTLDWRLGSTPLRPAEFFALLASLGSLLALIGYAYGARALYMVRPFNTIALHTACAFFVCAGSILAARPREGMMASVAGNGPGGMMARRLLPAVLIAPTLIGWLLLYGYRLNWYSPSFALALFAVANIACITGLVWWTAQTVHTADRARSAAEQRLREREEHLAVTLRSIGDGVLTTDVQGCVAAMNPAAESLTGWKLEQARGRPLGEVFRIIQEDTRAAVDTPVERMLSQGLTVELNRSVLVAHDDSERPIAISAAPIRSQDGTLCGVVLVFHDQSEERRIERELRRQELRFKRLVDSGIIGMVVADPHGRIYEVNDTFLSLVGYAREDFESSKLSGAALNVQALSDAKQAEELRTRGVAGPWENELLRKDGTRVPVLSGVVALGDGSNEHVCFSVDLSALKRAEAALHESESRRAAVLETALDAMILIDDTGRIIEFNAAAERMFGYPRGKAIGTRVADLLVPPQRHERDEDGLRRYLHFGERHVLGKRVELEGLRADGTVFPVEVAITPTHIQNAAFFTCCARDLSEQRNAEKALMVSEARFRHLANSGLIGVTLIDLRGKIVEANDAYLAILGYDRADFEAGMVQLSELTPREWQEADELAVSELRESGRVRPREKEYFRKDGRRVHVLVGGASLDERHAIGFVLDLTDRKRAEAARTRALQAAERESVGRARAEAALRQTEEQLRQSQKMEAIGLLAGSIAHDFNNLLSAILGYVELLLEDYDPADARRADIQQIGEAGRRASELTRQLLAFGRRQVLQPKVLDLNTVVRSMADMLRRIIGEDVELSLCASAGPAVVYADPNQMEQVLLNLAVNARDAMPAGGKLETKILEVQVTHYQSGLNEELRPGPYVVLMVSDTGVGMEHAELSRIFEPFYTTKEKGKGTGLGLSTVWGIVKQSGGTVLVDSEPGRGSTFRVYLPRSDRVLEPESSRPSFHDASGTETILLVEDDAQVRTLAATILKKYGYQVLEAADGREALALCNQQSRPIDLLLTDVVMPHMSGRELWERLCLLRPGLGVLFMSGYTDDAVVRHGVSTSEYEFVQKPITPAVLLPKLRTALSRTNEREPTSRSLQ